MIAVSDLREKFQTIPPEVRTFLLRAFVLFVLWKSVYLLFLAPSRLLDRPLTKGVGANSAWLLNIVNPTNQPYSFQSQIAITQFEGEFQVSPVNRIIRNGKSLVGIGDPCNGLELIALYLGFLVAISASFKRKLIFALLGSLVIYMVNVVRCTALSLMTVYSKAHFDLAHHYIFKIAVYAVIFLLWVYFMKGVSMKKAAAHVV